MGVERNVHGQTFEKQNFFWLQPCFQGISIECFKSHYTMFSCLLVKLSLKYWLINLLHFTSRCLIHFTVGLVLSLAY